MNLSKKSKSRQRLIAKALASGKALGGLLAGLAATVFTGCRDSEPRIPMGSYPNPQQQTNGVRENEGGARLMGDVAEPEKPGGKRFCESSPDDGVSPEPEKTNVANERPRRSGSVKGKYP